MWTHRRSHRVCLPSRSIGHVYFNTTLRNHPSCMPRAIFHCLVCARCEEEDGSITAKGSGSYCRDTITCCEVVRWGSWGCAGLEKGMKIPCEAFLFGQQDGLTSKAFEKASCARVCGDSVLSAAFSSWIVLETGSACFQF